MHTRPRGITFAAVIFAAGALFMTVLAVLSLLRPEAHRAVLHALSPSGAGPEAVHTAMGRLLPLYYAVMAGLQGTLAAGFWRLWNWTRLVVIVMVALSLLLMVGQLPPLLAAPTAGAIGLTAVRVALCVLGLWYLRRERVRQAFQGPRVNAAAA